MIVDDHPVVRKGLASFLGHEPDIEVVGMADLGEQALQMAQELHPDVVLMDMSMPGMGVSKRHDVSWRTRPERA